jgi:2-polyprenyl-3-methyl-5-hydroxy-6-metoxy-1,4-benzoquinol methylase
MRDGAMRKEATMPDTSPGRAAKWPAGADVETSSDNYAARFAGPVGEWMLRVQERITLGLLADVRGGTVLDVGGGHGQLARPLCRDGWAVTVQGSDGTCRRRIADLVDTGKCRFQVSDPLALPFADLSFDAVLCFRLLTHCEDWQRLTGELCRVARQCVVVDYPTSQSLNAASPALFGAKKRAEGNTRPWRLFRHSEIREAFRKHGFGVETRRGQFFLPMVLHRILKCRSLTRALEGGCRALGLIAVWGSPVIVKMVRE